MPAGALFRLEGMAMNARMVAIRRRLAIALPAVVLLFGLGAGAALAAPAASISYEDGTHIASWSCYSSGALVLKPAGSCYAQPPSVWAVGGGAGQVGTLTITSVSTGAGADSYGYVCTGSSLTGGDPATLGNCTGFSSGFMSAGAGQVKTFTVPSSGSFWIEFKGNANITAVTVAGALGDSITYPAVNLTSISDSVGGFFAFLAPVLWLIGGISIGGLLLHKARGLM